MNILNNSWVALNPVLNGGITDVEPASAGGNHKKEPIMHIASKAVSIATAAVFTTVVAGFSETASASSLSPTTINIADAAAQAAGQPTATGHATVRDTPGGAAVSLANSGISLNVAGKQSGQSVISTGTGTHAVAESVGSSAVRLSFVLDHKGVNSSMSFKVEGASRLTSVGAGGVLAYDKAGHPVAYLAQPWARDARGHAVPTRFIVSGTSVRQVVETGAHTTFPVTADPYVRWVHWWLPEVFFNHYETGRVRNPEVLWALAGTICALVAAESLGVGCAAFAAESGAIAAIASNAYGDNRCLALRWGVIPYDVSCSTGD